MPQDDPNRIEPAFDPCAVSIGGYCGEELRRICQEAIARGEAQEKARHEARSRLFSRLALCLELCSVVVVLAVVLFAFR